LCVDSLTVNRRGLVAFAGVSSVVALWPFRAVASARQHVGGKVSLRVPWPLASIDPHRIDDASAAIVGPSLFDSLYAMDESGVAIPWLAQGPPEPSGSRLVVTLRSGLVSALGHPMGASDVAHSLVRAGASGARAWLSDLLPPKVESPLSLSFSSRDATKLARILASPLTAIVPTSFSPNRPDGTGPLRADRDGDSLVLRRNDAAASGPAFLDEVVIRAAPDLAASLSAFESGVDDVGWLGSGLHEPRPGAKSFDGGSCAWAILRTGGAAGAWDAPGVAESLCDGIPPSRLAYLAVGPLGSTGEGDGWGGAPCDLLVRDDAPWLRELARAVAAGIGRTAHEVTARPVPAPELVAARASRAYALALDVARPLGPGTLGSLLGLATSDDPLRGVDLMRHPPRTEAPPRVICRTMRVGLVGDIRIQGGHVPDLVLALGPGRIDFGATTRMQGPAR
jgi:peptide/nickel transport system substrate-binding protein